MGLERRKILEEVFNMAEKYWLSDPPDKCDVGGEAITTTFIDGKSKFGPWGFMCPICFALDGIGLGVGRGQKYELQDNGKWLKTEG